jgi:peptidyl-prolyl cis-trans isomerase D
MSVIQKIRDKGSWIIVTVIAIALIAFILQDRAAGKGGSLFSGNTTTVGKVNGTKISKAEFDEQLDMYKGRGSQSQLVGQLWSMNVEKILYKDEINKLGITVTPKELDDILFGDNPPQWISQSPEFQDQATGRVDINKVKDYFKQIKKEKNNEKIAPFYKAYINPEIEQRQQQKYKQLLAGATYVPQWMVEKNNADNNAIANISYVYVPYATIADSTIKVSDDEINAYIDKHKKEFKQDEEIRSISYVNFEASPTAADTTTIKDKLNEFKPEFLSTPSMPAFVAKTGSKLPYYDGFISRKEIKQAVKDSIIKVGVGNIYGPYVDANNMVIAKVIAAKQVPDTVKVRHILVATKQQQRDGSSATIRTDEDAKKLADSLATAIKAGSSFDSLVVKFSDDPGSKDKGGVYEKVTSGQMVSSFNDFLFAGKVGDKGVVKTDYGYHYMEVLSQKGGSDGYKIAYIAKEIVASAETENAANTKASQFAVSIKNKAGFDAAVKSLGKAPMVADVKENDFTIAGLEKRDVVRWVFDHNVGDVTEPISASDKYMVAIVTAINEKGLQTAAQARQKVEPFIRNEKKAKQIIETKFKGNTLEAYAQSAGVPVARLDSIAFGNTYIPNLGAEPKILGAAFNKDLQGKVSQPIAGANGVMALKGEAIAAKAAATDLEALRKQMEQPLKGFSNRAGEVLRKAASITDNRSKFF